MFKRCLDIVLAIIVLILSIPFILVILIAVTFATKEFPIIMQERAVSLNKKKIRIFKIRTIKSSNTIIALPDNTEYIYKKHQLERYVPAFCRYLRKSGLDEILQVWNILTGEMSFTGPRPLIGSDLEIMMKSVPELYKRRTKLNSTPGLTGMWQVYGDRSGGTGNLIELDEYYENNKSILLDLRLIAKSIIVLVSATHSDAILSSTFLKKENCSLNTRKFITQ